MIVVTHPTGNQNVRAVLAALKKAGLLTEYATTLAFDRSSFWLRYLPKSLRKELLRRSYELSRGLVHTRPWLEAVRLSFGRGPLRFFALPDEGWPSVGAVYRDLDEHVARRLPCMKNVRGVYAYADGASRLFQAAGCRGLKCFYDLPIAYCRTSKGLLEAEKARWPEWSATLTAINTAEEMDREDEELRHAELVFCPSRFVLDSLPEWVRSSKDIVVAPFGSPVVDTKGARDRRKRPGRLRVLFVGGMSQRKGLADLFEAVKRLSRLDIELVVMGSPIAPMEFYRSECPDFIYEPTRPHSEVLRLMRSCDLLAMPSIVEGRALVMQEAMSQGLPILITPNTGGEDLHRAGRHGVPGADSFTASDCGATSLVCRSPGGNPRDGRTGPCQSSDPTWEDYGAKIVAAIGREHLPPCS